MRLAAPIVATYSICACDLEAGRWGVATQSKFLAVGSVVPWAEPHVGAIATQSYANPRYGPDGLALLREGLAADAVVERLTAADPDRGAPPARRRRRRRAGGDVHRRGLPRLGRRAHRAHGYAAQGNILVSGETVDAMASTFEATAGAPLVERLLDCLDAAQAAGGDSRGQQSAAILVVERDGGYAGLSDVLVDLRVDDHPRPLEELRRLYGLHDLLFGVTPRDLWLEVDPALRGELDRSLERLGHASLADWAGVANLEERIDGEDAVDPVVLEQLRLAVREADRG